MFEDRYANRLKYLAGLQWKKRKRTDRPGRGPYLKRGPARIHRDNWKLSYFELYAQHRMQRLERPPWE